MELNSKITFYPDGSYDILVEEGKDSGFFVEVTAEELKQMATAYAESSKKKKEVLKKEVEASKKIGKKAIVKAFLKKAIEKKRKRKSESPTEEFKQFYEVMKAFVDAVKGAEDEEREKSVGILAVKKYNKEFGYHKITEYSDRRYSEAQGLAIYEQFRDILDARGLMGVGELVLEYWFDQFVEQYGRRDSSATTEMLKILKAIRKATKNYEKKKKESVEFHSEVVRPPYGPDLSFDHLTKDLTNIFTNVELSFDSEIDYVGERPEDDEEIDPEDEPYEVTYSVSVIDR